MTYYRTVIEVEVLTEGRLLNSDLEFIAYEITYGDASGAIKTTAEEAIGPGTMARLLRLQGSDPALFGLNDDGNEIQ